MRLIIHRCACSHPDLFKKGKVCCAGKCSCSAPRLGESEVIPSFDGMGAPVLTITTPGTRWEGNDTCACDSCVALYASLQGVSA